MLEADDTLRPDVVAMHHAFGGLPAEDGEFRDRGSNVGRLVPTDVDYDPITGMPRQGNIPVRVTGGFLPKPNQIRNVDTAVSDRLLAIRRMRETCSR